VALTVANYDDMHEVLALHMSNRYVDQTTKKKKKKKKKKNKKN
jgi:hypothetical protein